MVSNKNTPSKTLLNVSIRRHVKDILEPPYLLPQSSYCIVKYIISCASQSNTRGALLIEHQSGMKSQRILTSFFLHFLIVMYLFCVYSRWLHLYDKINSFSLMHLVILTTVLSVLDLYYRYQQLIQSTFFDFITTSF